MTGEYRRRRWTYSYRAWIDEHGGNAGWTRGPHDFRLWDLNRTSNGHNLIRIVRRRWPFYVVVVVGRHYRTVLKIGRGFR